MTFQFWLILLAVLAYGLLHSLLASLKIKAIGRRWFGQSIERWYRLVFNFIAVVTLLPILLLPVIFSDKKIYVIGFPWVIITTAIQILAGVMLLIGLHQTGISSFLGISQVLGVESTNHPGLIQNGLYHYIRHPLYAAGLLIIWLTPIMTWNLLGLIIGLTVYIFIGAYFEERKLISEYGTEYAEYRRHTAMLVPGLHLPSRVQKS